MARERLTADDALALYDLYAGIGMLGTGPDGRVQSDLRPWIHTLNTTLIGRKLVVDGVLVGGGQLTVTKQAHVVEIGYWVGKPHPGRGYGTRIVRLFQHLAFTELRCHRLSARTSSRHLASLRVLEKSGFQREGVLRDALAVDGGYADEVIVGLLRAQYLAQPPPTGPAGG